jgi:hypothetical protein
MWMFRSSRPIARCPKNRLLELSARCGRLYGREALNIRMLIESQNPDLIRLDDVLQKEFAKEAEACGGSAQELGSSRCGACHIIHRPRR